MNRGRLALVSFTVDRPYSPRGERSRALVSALGREWEVSVLGPAAASDEAAEESRATSSPARRLARSLAEAVLLDKHEPRSMRQLRRWSPDVDAAVLVCAPFSPAVHAARRLSRAGVPYVVDAGDPWDLTSPATGRRYLGGWRAARGERLLWQGARGGVVTTPGQARRLASLFPSLPILVRPNGYDPDCAMDRIVKTDESASPRRLRLVHFGHLYEPRLDVVAFMRTLEETGPWEEVSLTQYGSDWTGALKRLPRGVTAKQHAPLPWREAVGRAREYDLALAVGNRNPDQLPSKAVQYLTLPIPRLALTGGSPDDALTDYVRDKPGWLALSVHEPRAADLLQAHLGTFWTSTGLRPPAEEAWPAVTAELARFIERCVSGEQEAGSSRLSEAKVGNARTRLERR